MSKMFLASLCGHKWDSFIQHLQASLPFTCNKVLVNIKAMLGKKQFKRILILASWDSLLARLFLTYGIGGKNSPLVQTLETRVTSLELWM